MIYVIPDTQLKPGVKNPLKVIANHICDVKPQHVIHLGDHWDMPSLSRYDKGKKSHRIHSYLNDIKAGNDAMAEFWAIIERRWSTFREDCVFVILEGNHENRRNLAVEYAEDSLVGLLCSVTYDLSNWDIKVPFLEIIKIHGIEFSHFFQNTGSAHAIGTAKQLISKRHASCVAGHKQGFDYSEMLQGGDKTIQALIVGSAYYHRESYKTHTNHHWRGTVVLFNLGNTTGFDYARYSLETLDEKYEI